MFRTKFSIGVLLAIILLATQVFAAGAAPASQDTTPPLSGGTINSIEIQTNPDTLETTVLVTITDKTGTQQTLELSLETALAFDPPLVKVLNETEPPVVNEDVLNTDIEIDPTTVLNAEPVEETMEEEQHPVGSALSDFFSDLLGVDYGLIMEYHDDEGVGFGVIAQALWMTNALTLDDEVVTDLDPDALFAAILDAKLTKEFDFITLPDGSTPQNWGQFRKAVMSDREKAKENLGAVMSGRTEKPGDETLTGQGIETKSNNGKGVGNSNKEKNNPDSTTILENENNGKNTINGVGNDGNKDNNGNNANSNKNKDKDKSNNGKGNNK